MMSGMITLNCMVLGESPELAFVIEIELSKSIDHLKKLIKERRPDVFDNIVSVHIILWKVTIALDMPSRKLSVLEKNEVTKLGGEKQHALQKIAKVFPIEAEDHDVVIDIAIERPIVVVKGKQLIFFYLSFFFVLSRHSFENEMIF